MNKPTITEGTGVYSLKWEEGVEIDVTRARQHTRDGTVTGEIAVRSGINGTSKLLHQAQFNFSSTTTRKTLQKTLEERVHDPNIDWYVAIEQMCHYVVEWMRQGEPVRLLNTEEQFTKPEHLIYPFLLKDQPNVLYGLGESAKSLMASVFAIVMLLPWQDNPLGLIPGNKSVVPLVLDWETYHDEYGWRLQCLTKGLKLPYIEVPYRRCALPLADDLEAIQKVIREVKAGCIIVDSVAAASGGDLNAADVAIRLFTAIRQLNVSSVLIAHTAKDQEGKKHSIYGSAFFNNYARQVWYMKRENDDDPDEIRVGLFHEKHNNTKPHPPVGFKFVFCDGATIVEKSDIRDSYDMIQELSAGSRILALLKGGAMKPAAITEELGIPQSTTRMNLKRLKQRHVVIALEDGSYGLSIQG